MPSDNFGASDTPPPKTNPLAPRQKCAFFFLSTVRGWKRDHFENIKERKRKCKNKKKPGEKEKGGSAYGNVPNLLKIGGIAVANWGATD